MTNNNNISQSHHQVNMGKWCEYCLLFANILFVPVRENNITFSLFFFSFFFNNKKKSQFTIQVVVVMNNDIEDNMQ